MSLKKFLFTIVVLGIGAVVIVRLLEAEPEVIEGHHDDHGEAEDEFERGPNGGRLLESESFALEVTIFEDGVPPHFRIYPYLNGDPIPTEDVELSLVLHRLGDVVNLVEFAQDQEYLRSLQVVYEPHSFDVKVSAIIGGKEHEFEFESHEGRIQLSPDAAKFANLGVDTIAPRKIKDIVSLPGVIRMNEDRVVHVVPRISGVVRSVHKNFGESVTKGEKLAVIDSRELADAKSEYLAAHERRKLAESRFKREEDLHIKKVSSEDDFLTAKEAYAESKIRERSARQKLLALELDETVIDKSRDELDTSLTEYEIRSPLNGTVIEKHISGGEGVSADSDIFLLADLSTVWVEVTIYPQDLRKVRPGLSVLIRSDDLDSTAEGVVAYLDPLVGEDTRSARAIVELSNPDGIWRPGLYVTAEILASENEVQMAVPVEALQQFRDWQVVFAKFDDIYEIRMVELGITDGDWVEVVSGIDAGQPFVSHNSYVLKADLEKSGAAHDH